LRLGLLCRVPTLSTLHHTDIIAKILQFDTTHIIGNYTKITRLITIKQTMQDEYELDDPILSESLDEEDMDDAELDLEDEDEDEMPLGLDDEDDDLL
jgi:hypothetical protein